MSSINLSSLPGSTEGILSIYEQPVLKASHIMYDTGIKHESHLNLFYSGVTPKSVIGKQYRPTSDNTE